MVISQWSPYRCGACLLLMDDELALAGLECVVVVELLAADELLELRRRAKAVNAELALDELSVSGGPFPRHAVEAERLDRAAHVDRAVVHRVPEVRTDVSANDLAPALQHEAGVRAGVAADDDRASLLVDPGASADPALDHEVAAADGCSSERPGVFLDDDHAGHHVFADRPADPSGDNDLGTVNDAKAEVAEAALEPQLAAGQDPDADRVLGARVQHGHVFDALLVEEPLEL